MTVMTGRSIAPAVSPRARRSPTADLAEWRPRSLCRWVEDPDLFFDPRPERQRAAAAVCRGCPVRTQCLSAEVPHDDASYVSGVFGGLTETQRLALRGERQLGHVPHLGVAQRLAGPGWGTWVMARERAGLTLSEMCAAVAEYGLVVDEVTVLVAVWWLGGELCRVPAPCEGDKRRLRRRLAEDYGLLLRELTAAGLRQQDVAAYLGVPLAEVTAAFKILSRGDVEARCGERVAA